MPVEERHSPSGKLSAWVGDAATLTATLNRVADLFAEERTTAEREIETEVQRLVDEGQTVEVAREIVGSRRVSRSFTPKIAVSERGSTSSEFEGPPEEVLAANLVPEELTFRYPGYWSETAVSLRFNRGNGVSWTVHSSQLIRARIVRDTVGEILAANRPWWWRCYTPLGTAVIFAVSFCVYFFTGWLIFRPSALWLLLVIEPSLVLSFATITLTSWSERTSPRFEVLRAGKKARGGAIWTVLLLQVLSVTVGVLVRFATR